MSEIDWSMAPDATHYDQMDNNFLRQFAGISLIWHIGKGWSDHGGQYPDDLNGCERLIEKPKYFHQWTGEGLPPVGAVCELSSQGADWGIGTIQYTADNVIVWRWENQAVGQACACYKHEIEIRPIRTPEKIAAEERKAAIEEMTAGYDGKYRILADWAAYVYDTLGYRKQGDEL